MVYDDLVNQELLDFCPLEAERIYVGKRAGQHCMAQEEISAILVQEAGLNRHVVRLKGGDPLIFGRGGEEIRALAEAGIPYEIVPGVTAAVAAGAMAGIPLTVRGEASAVVLLRATNAPSRPARLAWIGRRSRRRERLFAFTWVCGGCRKSRAPCAKAA